MSTGLIAFMVPVVCVILVLVTGALKILKKISRQIDLMEVKLLDIEGKIH
jgi:hypothetical protein